MNFDLTDEQKAIAEMATGPAVSREPDPRVSWEEAGEFPWDFVKELADHGLTGIDIPEANPDLAISPSE